MVNKPVGVRFLEHVAVSVKAHGVHRLTKPSSLSRRDANAVAVNSVLAILLVLTPPKLDTIKLRVETIGGGYLHHYQIA